MVNKRVAWRLVILALLAGSVWVIGCNSAGTGGGGDPASGTEFVASADKVGTIELSVANDPVDVADTSPFSVFVYDQNGQPVPHIQISCDTEKELALVEPTSGVEMTDSWGHMSGVVGCVAQGSFQIGCRLPIGANKRAFVTVHCVGEAPAGFTGWPGAGGGTLGNGTGSGGVAATASPSPTFAPGFEAQITGISISDGGQQDTTSIDVQRELCPDGNWEIFTDTMAGLTVLNNSSQPIIFNQVSYTVYRYGGGGDFFSGALDVVGAPIEPNGGAGTFSTLMLRAINTIKQYYGNGNPDIDCDAFPAMCGFKNIEFTLYGENSLGDPIEISTSTALSLGDFDRCASHSTPTPTGGPTGTPTAVPSTSPSPSPTAAAQGGGGAIVGGIG